jgi:hypothetical protein
MKSNPKTAAIYAAAKAAKAVADQAKHSMNESIEGGEGPSGSQR